MTLSLPDAALIEALAQGWAKGFTTDPADMAPWLVDWRGNYRGAAAALLSPASVEEVAEIVRLAAQARVAIVPQGGNTSMVAGATPPAEGGALLLSLRRMRAIRAVSPLDNAIVAEAGVILSDLHDAAIAAGRRFPPVARRQGVGHDRRADLHQCGRHAGAALRHDARAASGDRGGAARRQRAPRPLDLAQGQSRL